MQIAQESATTNAALSVSIPEQNEPNRPSYTDYKVIRRNGAVVGFERELQAGHKKVKESVAPFAALVRGDGEQVRALSAEIEGRRRDFAALRARIEALR